ncbi:MAG TPA: BON domain-containing protein [Gammaproteobacteria bacterium]|nr:BON domain-containing protein [Gammaproteobacteria bacterium]
MKKMNFSLIVSLILSLTLSLQGCFFVAGAAAGAAAITIVYDQRTVDSILQDRRLEREITQKIKDDPELHNNANIGVTSFGQVILLTGEAPTPETRVQAENIARSVTGVIKIYNAIAIQTPTSGLSHANDTWITTKIKTEMLATKGLKSASIKVVTENGTVYLMGTVTKAQEQQVVNIARHASGVKKVIKIFQYKSAETVNEAPVTTASPSDNHEVVVSPQNSDDLQPMIKEEN